MTAQYLFYARALANMYALNGEKHNNQLQAPQPVAANGIPVAKGFSKVGRAPRLQLLQNENLAVETAASAAQAVPDALQALSFQEGSASFPTPPLPSSSDQRVESRGVTPMVFMPGSTNFQSPSGAPVEGRAAVESRSGEQL
jgi:hypothetical protein